MKRSRVSDEQIIAVIKEKEAGMRVDGNWSRSWHSGLI